MIAAGVTITLLIVLVVTIRLVAKSLYRDKQIKRAVHTREHVRTQAAPHIVRTTTS